jgi:hypothetical protein
MSSQSFPVINNDENNDDELGALSGSSDEEVSDESDTDYEVEAPSDENDDSDEELTTKAVPASRRKPAAQKPIIQQPYRAPALEPARQYVKPTFVASTLPVNRFVPGMNRAPITPFKTLSLTSQSQQYVPPVVVPVVAPVVNSQMYTPTVPYTSPSKYTPSVPSPKPVASVQSYVPSPKPVANTYNYVPSPKPAQGYAPVLPAASQDYTPPTTNVLILPTNNISEEEIDRMVSQVTEIRDVKSGKLMDVEKEIIKYADNLKREEDEDEDFFMLRKRITDRLSSLKEVAGIDYRIVARMLTNRFRFNVTYSPEAEDRLNYVVTTYGITNV